MKTKDKEIVDSASQFIADKGEFIIGEVYLNIEIKPVHFYINEIQPTINISITERDNWLLTLI